MSMYIEGWEISPLKRPLYISLKLLRFPLQNSAMDIPLQSSIYSIRLNVSSDGLG
jgi:hypothetical protein